MFLILTNPTQIIFGEQPEGSKFQAFIYDIVQHLYFKRFVAILVLANSFLLSVKWEPDDDKDITDSEDSSKTLLYSTFIYIW